MTTTATRSPTQRAPDLSGQTVVVIGGSAGIGLASARAARAEGADVVLTGRNPERARPPRRGRTTGTHRPGVDSDPVQRAALRD
jgi:NAD(P)-dependent dehydrogenase (short-subunit alcohol dehydrogenase family)